MESFSPQGADNIFIKYILKLNLNFKEHLMKKLTIIIAIITSTNLRNCSRETIKLDEARWFGFEVLTLIHSRIDFFC